MVRKGWTKVEVLDGWLQVIRGKRPPSVQWPRAGSQQQVRQTGKPAPESRKPPKTGSSSTNRQSVHPDQLKAAASARIQRIQISLGALQPEDVEERQALLAALEKAKRQADVPPVEKQILATEEYLARAKKRLLQHDVTIATAREALQRAEHNKDVDVQGIADGETLLQKLKTQVPDSTAPTLPAADPVGELARLQQMVADLQRQLQQHGSPMVWFRSGESIKEDTFSSGGFCSPYGRRTRAVDARQTIRDGRRHRRRTYFGSVQVGSIGGRGRSNTTELESQPFHGEQHGLLMPEPKPIRHQCGLLGVRVGEASNPGPPRTQGNRRHRSRSRNGARESQWVVSSDDEPLVGRSVAPTERDTTMSTALSSIVPASSRALARVQSVSRIVEDGSDDDRASIGRNVWARVGDSHRIEPQDVHELPVEGATGNASQCPVRSRSRSGDRTREARMSSGQESVFPATTQPAFHTLPAWADDSPQVRNVCPRWGCSDGSVPPGVLDALEQDLGLRDGVRTAFGTRDGVVLDLDTVATHVDPATTQLSSTVPASALMVPSASMPSCFRQAHRGGQVPQGCGIPVLSANRFAALTEIDARVSHAHPVVGWCWCPMFPNRQAMTSVPYKPAHFSVRRGSVWALSLSQNLPLKRF